MKRKALALLVFALTTFTGAFPTFALSIIYGQSSFNQSTNAITSGQLTGQQLGTGLTGIVNSISFWSIKNGATGAGVLNYGFYSGTNADCTAGTAVVQANMSYDPTGQSVGAITENNVVLSTAHSLDPTKYYCITAATTYSNILLGGTSGNTYSNGICSRVVDGSGSANCGSAVDLKFALYGTQTTSDTSYVSTVVPANASTTASTRVNIGFSYHARAADNINSYIYSLTDLTITNNITLTGTASTGDNSVSQNITLSSGHTYLASAGICSDTSGICYGGPTNQFNVVSGTFSVGTTYATSSVIGTIPNGTIPFNNINVIDDTNSTTSAQTGLMAFFNLPALMASRVPFGYLWDIRDLFNNATTTTNSFSAVYFDFGATSLSSSTKAILPSRLEVFSTTSVRYFLPDALFLPFYALSTAAIWFSLGGYLFVRIKNMFS